MNTITHVSDTAFWVGIFRAQESIRQDSLFKDPYAALLTAEKGQDIVDHVSGSRYVSWTVVIRTRVIDEMIKSLLSEGVDTIINLGAGLDTRPYRLELPSSLRWIEVDYPHLIGFKEEKLKEEKPNCHLERVSLDLANQEERQNFFSKINSQAKKVLILTEGVIPYLSEEQVSSLAIDLHAQNSFSFWITEYHSHEMYKNLRNVKKIKEMGNAPFQFFPEHWLAFFNEHSWKERGIHYLVEEGEKWGRSFPLPWWAKILHFIMPAKEIEKFRKMSGYIIFESR
ncbi:MAG: SAM-dependent methyltransferase [Bacteriovorax sp.]|nr:SAM-dependent methyltransferase [Bacteriovorax sp.]